MNKPFSIAIDGPAGAGKSTIAKALARDLGAMYLDTGAMYRAFGLAILRMGIDTRDRAAVAARAESIDVAVDYVDGAQRIFLAGEDVTDAIREPEVSAAASAVSAVPEVRTHMVALQRRIARGHDVVMDGRDIGTAVLPDATLKIYLTASAEERARRRWRELQQKGLPDSYEQVLSDIQARDYQDMHREASPLRPAEGSVTVDTTALDLDESIAALKRLADATLAGGR